MLSSLVMLATAVAVPLLTDQTRFTLVCVENYLTQTSASFGKPFMQSSNSRTQQYAVDLQAKTVTSQFGYKSEAEPWIAAPRSSSTFLRTPGNRIVFCLAESGIKCGQETSKSTADGSTVDLGPEDVVINLDTGTVNGFNFMKVRAKDTSWIQIATQITGRCHRK